MWKSMLMVVVAFPLSLAMLVIFGVSVNWRAGLVAGGLTFAICLILATLMVLFLKKFSLADVFLPLIFSVVWSLVLIPFSLGEAAFSAPAAIGSGLLLTMCLWRVYHHEGRGKNWLIFPILVYMYEMLPLGIPGVISDYFAFSGDLVYAIVFYFTNSFKNELPAGSLNRPLPPAAPVVDDEPRNRGAFE